jgi:hypothetical protein
MIPTGQYGSNSSFMLSQEFNTKASCEYALKEIKKKSSEPFLPRGLNYNNKKNWQTVETVKGMCIEK